MMKTETEPGQDFTIDVHNLKYIDKFKYTLCMIGLAGTEDLNFGYYLDRIKRDSCYVARAQIVRDLYGDGT